MNNKRSKYRILLPIFTIAFIVAGSYAAIQFAKGYRPTRNGIAGTGLLAASSFPPGAEVYIDGKLTTATDDTLNLPPGEYDVTIKKDGHIPWNKHLTLEKELVTQTNATLFRSVPGLSPLTLSGATNINPSPNGQYLAYAVTEASSTAKNGLYVLELSTTPLPLQNEPKQISRNPTNLDFSTSTLLWSPDSSQILVHFEDEDQITLSNHLLEIDTLNEIETLADVTARLSLILSQWEEEIAIRETKQFTLIPDDFKSIATDSATNLYYSPNEEKVMYTSTEYTTLPKHLIETPPATSTQPEERDLEPGGIYIYDLIEDKNFHIGGIGLEEDSLQKSPIIIRNEQQLVTSDDRNLSTSIEEPLITYTSLQDENSFHQTSLNYKTHYSPLYVMNFQWYPNSSHLIIHEPEKIDMIEYDATNRVTVYSGPFEENLTYPWPDGSKLIILTNLNPSSDLPANLYTIDIR